MASAAAAASLSSGAPAAQAQLPHVVIFPFMAKGHTIPLTHLAHLLRRRQLAIVTFFTTPGNAAFIRTALSGADGVAVVELPFPDDHGATVPGLPRGAESAEALDSLSSFPAFVEAASLLLPRFEEALAAAHPPASAVVADALLHWAHAAAAARGVPTLAFFAANVLAHVVREACHRDNPAATLAGGTGAAAYAVPEFPDVQLSLADIPLPFDDPDLTAMASAGWTTSARASRTVSGGEAWWCASGWTSGRWAVLWHGGVKGFLSHGGWNSVVESISAGVPLAVWPMSAEQPLNAKMVADELRVGIRVPAKDGVTGAAVLVKSEEIATVIKELITGEKALGAKAREAMEEGGSSWRAVEEMIAGLGRHQPA
ncbi:unnamed protein product [Urochloa decumbens]|uniref:Glycosyltransferase n=1 Tax=Urochloa decumbens TaxID=240449 RepID=A0ABC9FHP8_9POAL